MLKKTPASCRPSPSYWPLLSLLWVYRILHLKKLICCYSELILYIYKKLYREVRHQNLWNHLSPILACSRRQSPTNRPCRPFIIKLMTNQVNFHTKILLFTFFLLWLAKLRQLTLPATAGKFKIITSKLDGMTA